MLGEQSWGWRRCTQVSRILMPYDDTDVEDDLMGLRDSDSGCATFLARALTAVQECCESGWIVHCIPKPYIAMKDYYHGAMEHEARPLKVPLVPLPIPADATPGDLASCMLSLYPPRGTSPPSPHFSWFSSYQYCFPDTCTIPLSKCSISSFRLTCLDV